MEMSKEAVEALENQAFEEGYQKGYHVANVEADDRLADTRAGMNDENARLKEELESYKNALMIKAAIVEGQKAAIEALENKLKETVLWADKQHKADRKHIEELHDAIEPKQQQIQMLQGQLLVQRELIDELRQAILKHVKETMR
jgi:tRNA G18 (ribose-2'-O)-methylase SpoU